MTGPVKLVRCSNCIRIDGDVLEARVGNCAYIDGDIEKAIEAPGITADTIEMKGEAPNYILINPNEDISIPKPGNPLYIRNRAKN